MQLEDADYQKGQELVVQVAQMGPNHGFSIWMVTKMKRSRYKTLNQHINAKNNQKVLSYNVMIVWPHN